MSIFFNWNTSTQIFINTFEMIKTTPVYYNTSESLNKNIAVKYYTILYRNLAKIFPLQWNMRNIRAMLVKYYVLCGI